MFNPQNLPRKVRIITISFVYLSNFAKMSGYSEEYLKNKITEALNASHVVSGL